MPSISFLLLTKEDIPVKLPLSVISIIALVLVLVYPAESFMLWGGRAFAQHALYLYLQFLINKDKKIAAELKIIDFYFWSILSTFLFL